MGDWNSALYKACILGAMVAFLVGLFTNSETSYGSYVAGYSVLILGILIILVILFSNIMKFNGNSPMTTVLLSILNSAGPFLLILGIISFILYLLIKYKNNIINGNVSPGYNSFSNIIIILLFLQLYLVYSNITKDSFQESGKISKITSSLMYLIGTITTICSVILYTILKYYSTDGFC